MGTALPTPSASRRWTGRVIRLGLVLFALVFLATWVGRRVSRRTQHIRVQRAEVTDQSLAPGDLRIYNVDSTVDLILRGNMVLAGLSPKTIAKVRDEVQKSTDKDTTGLGGFIAQTVKQTVANAVTTHVAYPLSEMEDIVYENGTLVIHRRDGGTTTLFGNTKVDGQEAAKSFRADDAARFVEAVRRRKRELDGARR